MCPAVALALICLTAGKSLDELTDGDFAVFARDLAARAERRAAYLDA